MDRSSRDHHVNVIEDFEGERYEDQDEASISILASRRIPMLGNAIDAWNEIGVVARIVGSEVLQEEARSVKNRIRKIDEVLYNYGGSDKNNKNNNDNNNICEEEVTAENRRIKRLCRKEEEEAGKGDQKLQHAEQANKLQLLLSMSRILDDLEAAHNQFKHGLLALLLDDSEDE